MKTALFEIQPSEKGRELSWFHFRFKKVKAATSIERKLGLTVHLTDAISNVLKICKAIDPNCKELIEWYKGVAFPDFIMKIVSDQFEIEAEKKFVGGSNRENIFNFKVTVTIFSQSAKTIHRILNTYKGLGPNAYYEFVNV